MNKTHWNRARFADRPTRSKRAQYDRQNAEAAAVILANPERHSRFQMDWAQRFLRRRAQAKNE